MGFKVSFSCEMPFFFTTRELAEFLSQWPSRSYESVAFLPLKATFELIFFVRGGGFVTLRAATRGADIWF
jgi:hypothetical protein